MRSLALCLLCALASGASGFVAAPRAARLPAQRSVRITATRAFRAPRLLAKVPDFFEAEKKPVALVENIEVSDFDEFLIKCVARPPPRGASTSRDRAAPPRPSPTPRRALVAVSVPLECRGGKRDATPGLSRSRSFRSITLSPSRFDAVSPGEIR